MLDIHDRISAFGNAVDVALRYCQKEIGCHPVANATELSEDIRRRVRAARQTALLTIGKDADAPMRVLAELDILNAYGRMRSYYLNIAETLAGAKQ